MSKDSAIDYISYILFKALGPFVRMLPLGVSLFLGRRLGDLLYYFDLKHKAIAHANIKRALGNKLSHAQICRLTKGSYRAFGQNFIEIFLIPSIDEKYLFKYITVEGRENIEAAFKKGKGVIFLAVHAGSWELSNVICSNLGFPFNFVVREQRHPRLNELLNHYRSLKGCKILHRQNQTRELIEVLKRNESIGVTVDQGGRDGVLVKFFGKEASMATGALRLALKYDSVILPAYHVRINGPYAKVIIKPPFEVAKSGNMDFDVRENLLRLMPVYERLIAEYPREYMWTYKIWKYSKERNILILNDGKTGHLRQSQAVAALAARELQASGIKANVRTVEVKFKNKLSQAVLAFSSLLSGKYICQGCLLCLKKTLNEASLESFMKENPDIIISAGSSLAPVNYLLSRANTARSVVLMRPGLMSVKRFSLAIIPRHDHPPKVANVLATEGALNLIDGEYLRDQSRHLAQASELSLQPSAYYIGLLLGGDARKFILKKEEVREVIRQVKLAAESLDADILVTTSRRTSKEAEAVVKDELRDYPRAKLVVIANELNIPEAVGGILGLSRIVVSSAESISMICEAVASAKITVVFQSEGLSNKHKRFIDEFAKQKYIYLVPAGQLSKRLVQLMTDKPEAHMPKDRLLISQRLKKLL
ncbi:MAG: ELM1/GtrOC1 family putative glycosyltransferase [Candidatus Omnitrophica bacterium]|nr:ELM1/GtrOC1 family putative glycosyltransferase [Candidatus Omnitrophota bacterium]